MCLWMDILKCLAIPMAAVVGLWWLAVRWASGWIAGGIYPTHWRCWDQLVNLVERFPPRR